MKILILKPSALGDVIQALPVLRLLRQHHPEAKIYWWINSELAPLLENDPDLAGVFRFERKRWRAARHWPELVVSVRALRAEQFDLVLDLQSLARSGTVAWLANGKYTVGLDDAREGARGYYDLAVPRPSETTHAVDWYLQVLRVLKVPVHADFEWLPRRPQTEASVRSRWQTDGRPWVILCPGARWLNKRWPAEYFASTVRQLAATDSQLHFAVIGGREDAAMGETIKQAAPDRCLNLAGETSLAEMIEWVRLGRLLITNDTGPMHVAAALKRPLIGLFGPTHPSRTGPYGAMENVVRHVALSCVPCLKDHCSYDQPLACLTSILPEQVVRRAQVELARSPS